MKSPSTQNGSSQELDDRMRLLVRSAGRGSAGAKDIGKNINRLSMLFGAERADRKKDYLQTEAHRAAYLAFFTPRSAMQTALLLRRAQEEGHLALPPRPRVLDLGSGPLSGILGAWLAAGDLGRSHAVDLSARALSDGQALVHSVCSAAEITTENVSVTAPFAPEGAFDLVILSHVLNEIGDPRRGNAARIAVLRRALSKLAPGGRILIVEPATRVHGRALMRLRDEVAAEGHAEILAPCPARVQNCPLLSRPADWCHADLRFAPPPEFSALAKAARLPVGDLKVSTLLVAAEGSAAEGARLVGGVMTGQGRPEGRYACTARGLVTLTAKAQRLPPEVREPMRGTFVFGSVPAGVSAAAAEAPSARTSGSRRRDRGRGGGGGRRRS